MVYYVCLESADPEGWNREADPNQVRSRNRKSQERMS